MSPLPQRASGPPPGILTPAANDADVLEISSNSFNTLDLEDEELMDSILQSTGDKVSGSSPAANPVVLEFPQDHLEQSFGAEDIEEEAWRL